MGSPLSPATWLRGELGLPGSAAGSHGYLRLLAVGLLLAIVGMYVGMLSLGPDGGRIDGALPWLLLGAVRWMAPREIPVALAGDPTPRLRHSFALTAAVLFLVPLMARELDRGMFRPAMVSDNSPENLSLVLTTALWLAVPLCVVMFSPVPRRLLALLARPALVLAMALGAPLVVGAAVRHVGHPDPSGYLARLTPLAALNPRVQQVTAVPVGRCTVWHRGRHVSLDARDASGRVGRWLYTESRRPLRVDWRRGVVFVSDVWTPQALDLRDCSTFASTLRRLAHDLAPPISWTVAAVMGFVAAALTLRRARALRRTFGDPSAWREATRTSEGELLLEGSEMRLRANGTDTAYTGPVVLLRGVVGATAHYRDVPALGPDDYVEGDRAAVLRAIAAAGSVADAEAMAYVVAACAPLAACASLGLMGWP